MATASDSNGGSSPESKPKRKRSSDPFSLRELGPGRWQVQVTVGYSALKKKQLRKSKVLYGNKKDVRKRAGEFAVKYGQKPGETKMVIAATTQALLNSYETACSKDWAPKTALEQGRFIRNRLGSLANIPARDLSRKDVLAWRDELRQELAPSSVRRILAVVKAGLAWAVEMEIIDSNPADTVTVKQQPVSKPRLPTKDDLRNYVEWVAEHDARFGALLRLAIETGARRGELVGLKVNDFDVESGELTFKRVVTDSQHGMVVKKYLKAGKFKKLSVDTATMRLVLAHAPRSGFVYSDDRGRHSWRVDRVTKTHLRYRKLYRQKFSVDVGRFHGMRDFHATDLLASGDFSIADVAQRLGHASPAITLQSYAHAIKAHDQKAGDHASSMFK